MTSPRLAAAIEVSGLIRLTEVAGGFSMVQRKGEPESGTILAVILDNQGLGQAFERMPQSDGTSRWTLAKRQNIEIKREFEDYLTRRMRQDPDLWVIELTIADGERLILNRG